MPPSPENLVGEVLLDKLRVIRVLGTGGMGTVYEVEHLITGHHRALKVLHGEAAASPETVTRFLREARVAAAVPSPHIVQTFDAGTLDDGSPYSLMEMLDGAPLYDLVVANGRLEPAAICELVSQVCDGLEAAHAAGIVHRDLKPENIFVLHDREGPRVKIIDFGISKFTADVARLTPLTQEGTIVGTPYYMSPEMAAGKQVDARADVYALGVIMYEAVSGRVPYMAASWPQLAIQIHEGRAARLDTLVPEVDPRFERVVRKAMHRRPAKRHQSAVELREALRPLRDPAALGRVTATLGGTSREAGTLACHAPSGARAAGRSRGRRAVLLAGGVVLAGLMGWLYWTRPARPQAPLGRPLPVVEMAPAPPGSPAPRGERSEAVDAGPSGRSPSPAARTMGDAPAPPVTLPAPPVGRVRRRSPPGGQGPGAGDERGAKRRRRGRELGLDRDNPYR